MKDDVLESILAVVIVKQFHDLGGTTRENLRFTFPCILKLRPHPSLQFISKYDWDKKGLDFVTFQFRNKKSVGCTVKISNIATTF